MSRSQELVIGRGQDLKQLINDALSVQDGLNTVKDQLAHLDSAENTAPLTRLALDCQERFYDLLMNSRDAASILMAHLDDFTRNIVPLVQDPEVSQSDKLIEVKSAAELIATTAQESPTKTREEFKSFNTMLKRLAHMVREYSKEISTCAQIPMNNLLNEIYGIEIKLKTIVERQRNFVGRALDAFQAVPVAMGGYANGQSTETALSTERHIERPAEVRAKKLIAFVKTAGEACICLKQWFDDGAAYTADSRILEQKRFEVARLRNDIEDKQIEIERAQQGLNRVALQFTVLSGKLGQFEGIWNKLIEDVKALHEYLENPNPWLTAKKDFERRVFKEGVLYQNIRGALEIYAIKARRTH